MKIILKFILLFFLFSSCIDSDTKKETEYLRNAIEQASISNHYKWIVILPGTGCHGCIQEGEYFLKSHIENNEILFVLTKISSLKILQQKTEVNLNDRQNVFIDRELFFNIPTQNNIYPCVVSLKDGKIVSHSFQSPGTTALYDLEKLL